MASNKLQRLQIEPAIPPAMQQNDTSGLRGFFQRTSALWICLVYLTISGSLILVNKHLLVDLRFHFPITVAMSGMCSSFVFSYIACKRYGIKKAQGNIDATVYVRNILPIGLCMALTLHLGNLVYFYLSVSFIQMLKSTSPIMVMVALYVAQMEKPNTKIILTVLVIAFGMASASFGSVNLSILGVVIMLAAEMAEAIKLVLMQKLLVGFEFHPIEGLMYLAPACCFWLGLAVLVLEAGRIATEGALVIILRNPGIFLFSSVAGFFVNLTALLVIHQTSSLTLKILGTVRSAMIVLIASFVLGETVTMLQYLGYGVSLIGFYGYTMARMQAAQQAAIVAAQQKQLVSSRPGSILNVR